MKQGLSLRDENPIFALRKTGIRSDARRSSRLFCEASEPLRRRAGRYKKFPELRKSHCAVSGNADLNAAFRYRNLVFHWPFDKTQSVQMSEVEFDLRRLIQLLAG
jgi:hypothetical protein